jgi:hypothetical protein
VLTDGAAGTSYTLHSNHPLTVGPPYTGTILSSECTAVVAAGMLPTREANSRARQHTIEAAAAAAIQKDAAAAAAYAGLVASITKLAVLEELHGAGDDAVGDGGVGVGAGGGGMPPMLPLEQLHQPQPQP